jgi:hypothetical protein
MLLDPVEQAEGSGIEQAGVGTAFHQTARAIPLPEADRVVQWCAVGDDSTFGFDVGARIE